MNLPLDIRILDYNVQYYDFNDRSVILMLELKYQRSAQRMSYDNFWVIIFIIQDQES